MDTAPSNNVQQTSGDAQNVNPTQVGIEQTQSAGKEEYKVEIKQRPERDNEQSEKYQQRSSFDKNASDQTDDNEQVMDQFSLKTENNNDETYDKEEIIVEQNRKSENNNVKTDDNKSGVVQMTQQPKTNKEKTDVNELGVDKFNPNPENNNEQTEKNEGGIGKFDQKTEKNICQTENNERGMGEFKGHPKHNNEKPDENEGGVVQMKINLVLTNKERRDVDEPGMNKYNQNLNNSNEEKDESKGGVVEIKQTPENKYEETDGNKGGMNEIYRKTENNIEQTENNEVGMGEFNENPENNNEETDDNKGGVVQMKQNPETNRVKTDDDEQGMNKFNQNPKNNNKKANENKRGVVEIKHNPENNNKKTDGNKGGIIEIDKKTENNIEQTENNEVGMGEFIENLENNNEETDDNKGGVVQINPNPKSNIEETDDDEQGMNKLNQNPENNNEKTNENERGVVEIKQNPENNNKEAGDNIQDFVELGKKNNSIENNSLEMRRKVLKMELKIIQTYSDKNLIVNDNNTLQKKQCIETYLSLGINDNETNILLVERSSTELMKEIKIVIKNKTIKTVDVETPEKLIEVPDYRSIVTVKGTAEDVRNCIKKAMTAKENGKYDRAISLLQKAERMLPTKNARDLLQKVIVEKELKLNPEPTEEITKGSVLTNVLTCSTENVTTVKEEDRINAFKCLSSLKIALKNGEIDKAERLLEKAKRLHPLLNVEGELSLIQNAKAEEIRKKETASKTMDPRRHSGQKSNTRSTMASESPVKNNMTTKTSTNYPNKTKNPNDSDKKEAERNNNHKSRTFYPSENSAGPQTKKRQRNATKTDTNQKLATKREVNEKHVQYETDVPLNGQYQIKSKNMNDRFSNEQENKNEKYNSNAKADRVSGEIQDESHTSDVTTVTKTTKSHDDGVHQNGEGASLAKTEKMNDNHSLIPFNKYNSKANSKRAKSENHAIPTSFPVTVLTQDNGLEPKTVAKMMVTLANEYKTKKGNIQISCYLLERSMEKCPTDEAEHSLQNLKQQVDYQRTKGEPLNLKYEANRILDKADNCIRRHDLEDAESLITISQDMDSSNVIRKRGKNLLENLQKAKKYRRLA